jgi:cytochrome c553
MSRPEQPSYLRLDRAHDSLVLQNPGSPVVSSHGARNAIVWILDSNKPRSASLYGLDAPQPVLYAVDAESMRLLWRSRPGELQPSGKYNEASVADGLVIVGTDRIQVFGLGAAGRAPVIASRATLSPGPATTETAAAPATGAADLAEGARLYAERCRACHESNQSGIPTVEKLYGQRADAIVEKLLLGSMQTQALGLTERQIGQVALFLTGAH